MLGLVEVQNQVDQVLRSPWAYVTGEKEWLHEVPLHPVSRPFGRDRARLDEWSKDWEARERDSLPAGVSVRWEPDGPDRVRPRALVLNDLHAAARFVGRERAARIEAVTAVFATLADAGVAPSAAALRRVVDAADRGTVVVDDLARAVRWVAVHEDLSPWSPRRAGPDAGVDTKWFANHAPLLKAVCGSDVVGRMQDRPRTILFSYADHGYLAQPGVRRHDSWTTGDALILPYHPRVVVIVENSDSRFAFPSLDGGVVVYGGGDAAPAFLEEVPWPTPRPAFVYWGDMDRDGFEILAAMRQTLGDDVRSILMDRAAYERYHHRGGNFDEKGRPIAAKPRREPLDGLGTEEAAADGLVCADGPVRRVEQEAIDVDDVITALGAAGLADPQGRPRVGGLGTAPVGTVEA